MNLLDDSNVYVCISIGYCFGGLLYHIHGGRGAVVQQARIVKSGTWKHVQRIIRSDNHPLDMCWVKRCSFRYTHKTFSLYLRRVGYPSSTFHCRYPSASCGPTVQVELYRKYDTTRASSSTYRCTRAEDQSVRVVSKVQYFTDNVSEKDPNKARARRSGVACRPNHAERKGHDYP